MPSTPSTPSAPLTGASLIEEVARVLDQEAQALVDCAQKVRTGEVGPSIEKTLTILSRSLDQGGKIVVTGLGKSGKVAQKIVATFCSTGTFAVFLHPTEGLHGDLGVVSSKDAVLALSQTGNTDDIVLLLPSLKALGVPVIALTGGRQSRLATAADVWIDTSIGQEACPYNLAPTTSTTLALALGDALAVALMRMRGFDPASFAKNHPGGAIGRRLRLTVADVMHSGDEVPVVGPEATMDEVVIEATRKPLFGVLIAEGPKLVGLITDGDIRRSLHHREKFFTFRAKDIMTAGPITVLASQMAKEALAIMEDRPRQLSVLPVVDDAGNWKGLVRVHDLVRVL